MAGNYLSDMMCPLIFATSADDACTGTPGSTKDETDVQPLIVCRACQEAALRCDVCGLPIAVPDVHLPDGLRQMLRLEKQQDAAAVLAFCRRSE